MNTAHQLIREVPLTEENTLKEATASLKEFEPLNTTVPVYKNGNKKKLYDLNGYQFLIKAVYGNCTKDELQTLHKKDSIVYALKALQFEPDNDRLKSNLNLCLNNTDRIELIM